MRSALRALAAGGLALLLAACAAGPAPRPETHPRRPAVVPAVPMAQKPGGPTYVPGAAPLSEHDRFPDADEIPDGIDQVPDAVPQVEPRARSGNSPVYEVFGKTYKVLDSADGFHERGYASWYGKKFHGHKTASGEIYDMFGMSAAHKRLPLPSYVRVTNVANGKSAIVRVNDRGPFHPGRVIDLSYAAAARLDILGHGHALVELEALAPAEPGETAVAAAPPPPPAPAEASALPQTAPPPASGVEMRPAPGPNRGYLQIASFVDPINAVALREELGRIGIDRISVLPSDLGGELLHRVVAGPFSDEASAAELRRRLRGYGYSVDWVTQ